MQLDEPADFLEDSRWHLQQRSAEWVTTGSR
jgi:hypothetical protein